MRAGYGIGLLLLCACSSSRTYSTGGQTEPQLRAVLARRDWFESALATPQTGYFIPSGQLTAETDALLTALHEAKVEQRTPPYGVTVAFNETVVAWARPHVFEAGYRDGTLHVEWRSGQPCHVAFEQGKEVSWMDLAPSPKVAAAMRALGAAAQRQGKLSQAPGGGAVRPLQWLRQIVVDSRGLQSK